MFVVNKKIICFKRRNNSLKANMAPSSEIKYLFDRFWAWRIREFPEFATFCGEHLHDNKLQSYIMESIKDREKTVKQYLEEAQLLFDKNMDKEDQINLTYFVANLKIFLKGQAAEGYFFPLSYMDGPHVEFERLLDVMKKESETDYLKILDRLVLLPRQISEIMELMREGIKNEMTFHMISVSGVLKQLDMLQKPVEESIFYKPFKNIPDDVSFFALSKTELLTNAKNIIETNVLPAFKELRNFIENEYFKHCRPDISINSLSTTRHQECNLYTLYLDHHISFRITPEEVHKIGENEVKRIKQKMEKVIETLELKMSVKEFSDHIREKGNFVFQNVEELLEAYKGVVFNQIEPKLPQLFSFLPKSKLVIDLMPSSNPNAPAAFYFAGTADGKVPGSFLINAATLDTSFKYDVMTLSLHEAVPGHHLQNCYMLEDKNMPCFRKFVEDRRYTEAPSVFPVHTAYCEGWALYCEHLGYELGLYDDPYLEYGHLSHDMLRACRLVVDTGIHAKKWTREMAIDYMLEHTAVHRTEIENEVNRYITWPGQACGYMLGKLKIQSLRQHAEEKLGTKFDVHKFHDVVLQSFGPLEELEERVFEYVRNCS